MTAPDSREFTLFPRGYVRDNIILAVYRNALRAYVNPDTGATFTEDEIQRATQPGTRFYIDADAIDLHGQGQQARAMYWVDQVDPQRANSLMLRDVHGRLWLGANSMLPAVGATGFVDWSATNATIFVGSQTLGDASAFVVTDPNGRRYQCLTTVAAADGVARLNMRAIDGGFVTNLAPGTKLVGSVNTPLGAQPQALVAEQPTDPEAGFVGGFDAETDQEYSDRIQERILFKPASGNSGHFIVWARSASVAVSSAFVYACALHAGSTLVTALQKRDRSQPRGPLARLPTATMLADLTAYLVPPASPVVPERVFVSIVPVNSESVDLVVRLTMRRGTGGGWQDVEQWPAPELPANPSAIPQARVTAVTNQTTFVITTEDSPLPNGETSMAAPNVPLVMIWDESTSRFEQLSVATIVDNGDDTFSVTLSTAPTTTIAVGSRISPYTDRHGEIAQVLEDYFDNLGPGELTIEDDVRFARCARFPRPSQKWPARAGQGLAAVIVNVLGGAVPDAEITHFSKNEPTVPADPYDGPSLLTLGKVNIYAF